MSLAEALEGKANKDEIPSIEGLASEEFVNTQIAAIEFPEYDDTDINNRMDAIEAIDHSQFLTEHQDISHLAEKSELQGLASESYVDTKVADLVGAAPETLDTLQEIAKAFEDHEDAFDAYVSRMNAELTNKVDAVEGKDLIDVEEIERLSHLRNYDDSDVQLRLNILESVDHNAFLTEHQDISHLAVADEVDAAMAEVDAKVDQEAERAQEAEAALDARVEVLETLNLETKPYIDKNGMLVLCGCPAVARGVGEEVHVITRFFNNEEDKFVFTADEFAKLRICMGYGAEGVGTKRSVVETTFEMYDIDRVFIIDGGSQITGEIGTVNIIAERINYIDGLQGARAMNGGEKNIVHNFNIKIKDVKLIDTLFGGGNGFSVVWNSNVEVDGDTTINYLIAGGSNGYVRNSRVVLNNGHAKVMQGVNRGILDRAELIVNGGIVEKLYVGGEVDPTVTGVQYEGYVELNAGIVRNFHPGTSNLAELAIDKIHGIIAECVVENGDVSMLTKIEKEVEVEYASKEYVDEAVAGIEIPEYEEYDDTEVQAKVAALDTRISTIENIPHHDQANFAYAVEMVAADKPASFEVTGVYHDLVITLKLPTCYAVPPFDENAFLAGTKGTMGFTNEDEISLNMDMSIIQHGLNYKSLVAVEPAAMGKVKVTDLISKSAVELAAFLCVIVPKAANIVAYLDNGVGDKLTFSEIHSDDGSSGFMYCQDGGTLTSKINGVDYIVFGTYITTAGQYYLHIEDK